MKMLLCKHEKWYVTKRWSTMMLGDCDFRRGIQAIYSCSVHGCIQKIASGDVFTFLSRTVYTIITIMGFGHVPLNFSCLHDNTLIAFDAHFFESFPNL